jgi:hypothetical protein
VSEGEHSYKGGRVHHKSCCYGIKGIDMILGMD